MTASHSTLSATAREPSALSRAVSGAHVRESTGPVRLGVRALSLLAAAGLWQVCSSQHLHLGLIDFTNVPTPIDVAQASLELLHSPKLLQHLRSSVVRVFAGFAAAALVGIGLGLLIGRSRRAADLLLPSLEVLRPIPAVAWIPLAILMFPSSELSMMFITFLGAFFPILLNAIHGANSIDRRLLAAASSLGASRLQLLREVVLPGSLPNVVTGLAIGMGTAWFCLVTAEMIAGQYGIGYYTWESYNLQRYPEIIVGMLLIGAFGMGSSALVRQLGSAITPWTRLRGGFSHVG
jgi:NitT/TauT family transport system permease protein